MGNHLKSAEARLERRLKAYEQTTKTAGTRASQYNKPGSTKKPSPKGR